MKRYKFTQLSDEAKNNAAAHYVAGWSETHDDSMTIDEALELCLDTNNDVFYNEFGNPISLRL